MEKIKELYLKYKEIVNYLIFGVLTTIVSLAVKYILLFTILNPQNAIELQIAIIISWIAACLFAYVTNRKYVFESKSNKIFKELVSFFASRLVTLGIEMLIMYIFVTLLKLNSDTWVVIWTLISQVAIIIGNYIFSKLFVFKKGAENEKN